MRDEWYVARRGRGENSRYGPAPLGELRRLVDEGRVSGGDLVWREGMSDWRRADQCDELFPPPRGPRRYGPDDDDRPYRRYPPPRQSSSGWVVALVVGGITVVVCFLGCAGFGFVGYMNARPVATFKAATISPPPPMAAPAANILLVDDQALANRDFNNDPPPGLGRRIPFGASEVFYTDAVTLDEAQRLKDHLGNQGEFPDDHGATVQLDRVIGTVQVRFCLQPGADFDGHAWEARQLRNDIANNVFPGADVEVQLCDQNMNAITTARAGD